MKKIIILFAGLFIGATYNYNKVVDVDKLAGEIENNMGYIMAARTSTATVNGWITTDGNGHTVIGFYDESAGPEGFRETTLEAVTLTSGQENTLDSIVENHIP